jgi:hypothetical protein
MKIEMIFKSTLLVIVAVFMSATVSAQSSSRKALTYKGTDKQIMVGDTVRISRDCLKYETRERIIRWAFNKKHVVRQVNSKYHPNAILLKRIYSWIPAEAAVLVNRGPINNNAHARVSVDNSSYRIERVVEVLDVINKSKGHFLVEISIYQVNEQTNDRELIDKFVKDSICSKCAESFVDKKIPKRSQPQNNLSKAERDSIKAVEKAAQIAERDSLASVKDALDAARKDSMAVVRQNHRDSIAFRQYDRFSFGVRGGYASSMALPLNANQLPYGYEARVDLQYAHYWPTSGNRGHLGILTGVSAGYMNVNRHQPWNDTYSEMDEYGDILTYHVTADDIYENTQQVQVEVPLMMSWVGQKGLFFNVGPRFLLPIIATHAQTIKNGNIQVTDQGVGVTVLNNPVYGKLDENTKHYTCKNKYSWNVLVGLELGYEFKMKSGHSFGLGAYANYGIMNAYYGIYDINGSRKPASPITTTIPSSEDGVGTVTVKPLSESYTSMIGHLDAGIKLSFNFNFVK